MSPQGVKVAPWLRSNDRLLITGSNGWFGRTLRALVGSSEQILCVGSPRDHPSEQWELQKVREFAPTVVANFAFHTRDRLAEMGRDRFVAENAELTRRFLATLEQPSVRMGLTVSSGAAVSLDAQNGEKSEEIYGAMKGSEEIAALAMVTEERTVVVARAYSMSGPFVRRPEDYAFSGFILQALAGFINIEARQPVYRRYTAVADFMTVALILGDMGWSGVLESGGDLIEMQGLAAAVRSVVNPSASISRPALLSEVPSVYASDNSSWLEACRNISYSPRDLEQQIHSACDPSGFMSSLPPHLRTTLDE